MMVIAAFIAMMSGYFGLLISFHANLPSGPSIVLAAGFVHVVSLFLGTEGGLIRRFLHPPHLRG
jgi:zinc/manganese transport system permease protein